MWRKATGEHPFPLRSFSLFPLFTTRLWQPFLVSTGEDSTGRVWDLATGAQRAVLQGHTAKSLWSVSVAPGNGKAATGGNDGCAKIWDLGHAENFCRPEGDGGRVVGGKFPPRPPPPPAPSSPPPSPSAATATKKKKKKKKKPLPTLQINCIAFLRHSPPLLIAISCTNQLYVFKPTETPTLLDTPSEKGPPTCLTVAGGDVAYVGYSTGVIVKVTVAGDSAADSSYSCVTSRLEHVPSRYGVCSLFYSSGSLFGSFTKGVLVEYDVECDEEVCVYGMPVHGVTSSVVKVVGVGLFCGDTRGNLAAFYEGGEVGGEGCWVRNVHGKEHVTGLVWRGGEGGELVSVGHDGVLFRCYTASGAVTKGYGVKVGFGSVLTDVIVNDSGSGAASATLFVGGYHASVYYLWDVVGGKQVCQIDCGGWKRPHCVCTEGGVKLAVVSGDEVVYCESGKELVGEELRGSEGWHGRTCYAVSMFEYGDKVGVVSGSEDCTLKVTVYDALEKRIVAVTDLTTFESCVRAVGVCRDDEGRCLVVAGGGKLQLDMYTWGPHPARVFTDIVSGSDVDSRINAISCLGGKACVVVTGDSQGLVTVFRVTFGAAGAASVVRVGRLEGMSSRPVLSLECIEIEGRGYVVVGNTMGEVGVFVVDEYVEDGTGNPSVGSLKHVYRAHAQGANDLSVMYDSVRSRMVIASGGDDQRMYLYDVGMEFDEGGTPVGVAVENGSSSAVKSVNWDPTRRVEGSGGVVYAVGYDQRLVEWEYRCECDGGGASLKEVGRTLTNVTDVEDAGVLGEVCCVVGDGIEFFGRKGEARSGAEEGAVATGEGQPLSNLRLAATVLRRANYVMVTCGAGMSADSGLKTYEDVGAEYRKFCDPCFLRDEGEKGVEYWGAFGKMYEEAEGHEGYGVLREWLGGQSSGTSLRRLPHLLGSFCYTSNVDGLMPRLVPAKSCEIHGRAQEWVCAAWMGRDEGGEEKIGWSEFNKKVRGAGGGRGGKCEGKAGVQGETCCGVLMRPKVLMFNDSDVGVLAGIEKEREVYQEWEGMVEDEVCGLKERTLVIVEIGCGVDVPAVRIESLEVARDIWEKGGGERVHVVRINVKDEEYVEGVDLEVKREVVEESLVGLKGRAAEVLKRLDVEITKVAEEEGNVQMEEKRVLVFDDDWEGAGMDGGFGEFGEFKDDEDVIAKELEEEEELERERVYLERLKRESEEEERLKGRVMEMDDDF